MLGGCGRLSFDAAQIDATVDDDSSADRPNVAFVTAASVAGNFGGQASADAMCMSAAASQGMPGTFISFVSTTTSDAIDRLAGSRGWIRTDGAPIMDQPSDLLTSGHQINLIDHDETGARRQLSAVVVWTGSGADGRYDATNGNCNDWTSQLSTDSGELGFFDRTAPFVIRTGPQNCNVPAHLYCFEIGHVAQVVPTVTPGKLAFMSTRTSEGLSSFDARCQNDATTAGLPGTYLAAVATTTTTIASRFAPTSTPYVRIDGTQVSATGTALLDGTALLAPVNQRADGLYIAPAFAPTIATGTSDPRVVGTVMQTCADWTANTGTGAAGQVNAARPGDFWTGTVVNCNSSMIEVLCLQE